jgi:predicted adenine nucleotide alpha hydrolase (AANH) superfamily ATPase
LRVLLHACCGPCLLEPFDALSDEHDVVVYYDNPNIHPVGEYRRRRETLLDYARDREISVIEAAYEPREWIEAVAPHLADQSERCRACFALRLARTARAAAQAGLEGFATTLTVSPYQDAEAIRDAGEAAAGEFGLTYLHEDHRPRYQEAVRRSREMDMYRQDYCGCLLSEIEAEESRARRRKERT